MKQVCDLAVTVESTRPAEDLLYTYSFCFQLMQVEVLLEHGVDCEKRDQDGWTALLVGALSDTSCCVLAFSTAALRQHV